MLDRRAFLKRLAPAAAGIVVAPTLAETLWHGAKKYFFLNGNPLEVHGPAYDFSMWAYHDMQNRMDTINTLLWKPANLKVVKDLLNA